MNRTIINVYLGNQSTASIIFVFFFLEMEITPQTLFHLKGGEHNHFGKSFPDSNVNTIFRINLPERMSSVSFS